MDVGRGFNRHSKCTLPILQGLRAWLARAEPAMDGKLRVALGLYSRLGVGEVQVPPDVLLEVARRTGLTAYDAAYLRLARDLGAELLTPDRSLQQAVRGMPGPMEG